MVRNTNQIRIENLSKKRYKFLDEYHASYDEEQEDYTMDEPKEIDQLADEILQMIKLYKWDLPVEFILEELTKLGWAPCLLYDDEGHWAVSSEGVQSVAMGDPIDMSMSHFIEKEDWKPTIREALNYFLNND